MIKVKYDNGQEEALSFTPLSNTERYKYIDLLVAGNTPALIALCARRTENWVNRLDPDSLAELAGHFFQQVFPTVLRMARRDPITSLKIAPFQLEWTQLMQRAAMVGVDLAQPESSSAPGNSSSTTPSSAAPTGSDSPSAPAPAASAPGTSSTP